MALPTPPVYTDYTHVTSLEHPDCYVALYYRTSSFQVSDTHFWRITTYDKTTHLEINTTTIQYVSTNGADERWSSPNIYGCWISQFDDVLWVSHPHRGTDSYTVTGGVITVVSNIPDVGGTNWVNGACETDTHVWTADYGDGLYVFTKTGTGTVNTTPAFNYTDGNSQFNHVYYVGALGLVLAKRSDHKYYLLDKTTLTLVDDLSLGIDDNEVNFTDDTQANHETFFEFDRNGISDIKKYMNALGFYEFDNLDPANLNAYDQLVETTGNVLGWWKMDEEAPNTTMIDYSGRAKDLSIAGAFTKEDNLVVHETGKSYGGDKTGGYVDNNGFGIPSSPTYAIEGWVTIDSLPNVTEYMIGFSDYNVNSGQAGGFNINTLGNAYFHTYASNSVAYDTPSRSIGLGQTYHFVCNMTTSGMEFWLNGVFIGLNTNVNGIHPNYQSFFISRPSNYGTAHDGKIDNVIVYNTDLTAQEIRDRYAVGAAFDITGTYRELIESHAPVMYCPLDDVNSNRDFYDVSGNGQHCQGTSGIIQGTGVGVDGTPGVCMESPNIDGHYIINYNAVLQAGVTDYSFEWWFKRKLDEGQSSQAYDVFQRLSYASNNTSVWNQDTNYNYGAARLYTGRGDNNGTSIPNIVIQDDIQWDSWNHVCVVVRQSLGIMEYYINGVKVGESLGTLAPIHVDLKASLANAWTGSSYATSAYWQHWAIYDHALTPAQVLSHYEYFRPPVTVGDNAYQQSVIDDGPTHYYPMNETAGSILYDKMENTHMKAYGSTIDTITGTGINGVDEAEPCMHMDGSTYFTPESANFVGRWDAYAFELLIQIKDYTVYQIFVGPVESGGYYVAINDRKMVNYVYHSIAGYINNNGGLNHYNNEQIHYAQTFDGQILKWYINGHECGSVDAGSQGVVGYTTYTRYILGAQYGSSITEHSRSFMGHVAKYHNKIPPIENFRKRYLMSMGYDLDNLTAYEQHVMDDVPALYFPFRDTVNSGRSVATLAYSPVNAAGGAAEPDLRMQGSNTNYSKGVAGMLVDGSKCIEWTEPDGLITYMRNRTVTPLCIIRNDFTFEGWMNLPYAAPEGRTTIVSAGGSGGDATADDNILYKIAVLTNGSLTYIHEYDTGTNQSYTSGAGIFPFGTDVYLVLVRDDTAKNVKVYINGIVVWEFSYSNSATHGTNSVLRFGESESGSEVRGFIGKIQHFALHENALSETRIRERYALGSGVDRFDISDDYATDTLANAPAAYYRCNDPALATKLVDSSGNDKDGDVDIGTVSFQETGALQQVPDNKALRFDGTNHIRINDSIIPDSNSFVTVEYWAKFDAQSDAVSLHRGRDGFGSGWSLSATADWDSISLGYVYTSPSTLGGNVTVSDLDMELGVWHHLVFVWEFGVGITIYLDAKKVGFGAVTGTNLRNSSYGWGIGADIQGTTSYAGHMDEIAIYTTPLSHAQVIDRYIKSTLNENTFLHEVLKNIPANYWWRMDRVDGTKVPNEFGGSHGTIQNFAALASYPCVNDGGTESMLFPDRNDNSGVMLPDLETPLVFGDTLCFEVWFQMNQTNFSTGNRVVLNDGGTTSGWSLQFYNYEFGIFIRNGGTLIKCVIPHEEVPLGHRIQVVGIINGPTGAVQLYMNGKLVQGITGSVINDFNGSAGAAIGRLNASDQSPAQGSVATNSTFEGYIDDVIFYESLLDPAEILIHWDKGKLGGGYTTTVLEKEPIMWFRMDETPVLDAITDSVSAIQATTNTGISDTVPTWVPASFSNGGFDFDGTRDSFEIAHADINGVINYDKNYSVSVWIKISAYPAVATEPVILSKCEGGTHKSIILRIRDTGQIAYNYETSGNNAPGIVTLETIPLDTWTLVTVTVDNNGNGDVSIYFNDVVTSVNGETRISTPTSTSDNMTIAKNGGTYQDNFYDGELDELLWFNYPLTAQDVADIYNATATEYQVTGTVTQDLEGVERVVRVYRRDNGQLVQDLVSEPDGTFDLRWRELDPSAEYFVIAFDDDNVPDLEAIARDRLTPVAVP